MSGKSAKKARAGKPAAKGGAPRGNARLMRPSRDTYFTFLAFPIITCLTACYSLFKFRDLFSLVSALVLLGACIAVHLGLKRSYIKIDRYTLTVRNFFAKPSTIGLSSIKSAGNRQKASGVPTSLKIRVDQGDSRQKIVTIPIKWYARGDQGALLALLKMQ